MFCKNCGKEIPDESKWCLHCGASTVVKNNNEVKSNKEDNVNNSQPLFTASRTAWMYSKKIFICILTMIIAIVGGYSAYLANFQYVIYGCAFLFILALIVIISYILLAHSSKVIFYKNYVVVKEGIFNTNEKHSALTKIIGVSIIQTFNGKIFNYGNIFIDKIGEWDINLDKIRKPHQLKNYMEKIIQNSDYYSTVRQIIDDNDDNQRI
jgi:hypothetical protein